MYTDKKVSLTAAFCDTYPKLYELPLYFGYYLFHERTNASSWL